MVTAIFALIGVIIGFAGNLVVALVTKKAEERRSYRELALKIATEKFRIESEGVAKEPRQIGDEPRRLPPFDAYVIHAMRLIEIAQDTSLTTDQMATRLADLQRFSRATVSVMRYGPQTTPSE